MASRSGTNLEFDVPPPPDDGGIDALALGRLTTARYNAFLSNMESRNAAILEVLEQSRNALTARIGSANLKRFREFSRTERASNYGLGSLAHDERAPARLAAARRASTAQAAKLMQEANLKPSDLRPLNSALLQRVSEINARTSRGKGHLEVVSEAQVPARVLKGNPYTVRKPPFDGWEWWYSWWWDGFGDDPEFIHYTNSQSGSVGHRSQWEVWDAGGWDFYTLSVYSSVGFWLKPAKAGKLDLWIKNRCGGARYKVYWYDEAGWSDFGDNMFSSWTVNLSSGTSDEDETPMWEMHFNGPNDEEKTLSGDIVPPNTVGWLHMTTSDAIPANVWTYVKIGTYDTHQMLSDDVSLDSIMKNRWYFEEVHYDTLD